MIGRVLFDFGGKPAAAVLGDDGHWTVELLDGTTGPGLAVLAESIDLDHNLDAYSPWMGRRGYAQLADVARTLDGRVEAPEVEDGPAGEVY